MSAVAVSSTHASSPWARVQEEATRVYVAPIVAAKRALHTQSRLAAVWIVLIIAIAVVAAVGIMAYVATVCINRGGSFDGGLSVKTNGWKVWEYRLQFKCTR